MTRRTFLGVETRLPRIADVGPLRGLRWTLTDRAVRAATPAVCWAQRAVMRQLDRIGRGAQ